MQKSMTKTYRCSYCAKKISSRFADCLDCKLWSSNL